jgi:hypothetical protein
MAQTPISASVNFGSTTPTTIYTVPGGATAVVKSVIPVSVVGAAATVTLNKVTSAGTVYPLVVNAQTQYDTSTSTYYVVNAIPNVNLLPGPITLSAGESISISTSTSTYFKDPLGLSNTNYKLTNGNFVNGYYVALGQDASTGLGLILTSTDGITWTKRTFNFYVVTQDIIYGNGYYVVCNQSTGGTIHYSTDLVTWTEVALPSAAAMYSITYGGGKFLTAGNGKAFYATTTPLSWTAVVFPSGNASITTYTVSYIGTNYVFSTSGNLFTTTDFSTWNTPSYAYDSSGFSGTVAVYANKLYVSYSNPVNSVANRSVAYSSDGITFTNGTTSTTSGSPYNPAVLAFGNGGIILSPSYWPGTPISYSKSADGLTWTNVTGLSITNYANPAISYSGSVYPLFDTTRNYMFSQGAPNIQFNAVASDGTITAAASMSFSANSFYGNYAVAGNPTAGTWVAGSAAYFLANSNYSGFYYGSSPTNGNDSSSTGAILYIPSYGGITSALYLPGSNGFIFGTYKGYLWTNAAYNSTSIANIQRPTAVNSPIAAFACDGNTATSTIVYVQSNGYGAVSRDQGATWTNMQLPGGSFGNQTDYGTRCLQYVNGTWMAVNTSGQVFYSTTALTWSTAPTGVTNMATVNSNNVFLSSDGVFSTTGSNVTTFTKQSSTAFTSYPSNRNLIYASSTYLLGNGSTVYRSTDLATWTSASVSSTAINDVQYWSTANGTALLPDGSGNFLAVGAKRSSPSVEGKIGKPTTVSAALVVGNVTAGIVEIS